MEPIRERADLRLVDDQAETPVSFEEAFAEHTAQAFANILDLTPNAAS